MSEPCPYPDPSGLPAWDQRTLALLPSGVDVSQLVENLRLTPTERIEKLQRLLEAVEALRAGRR